MIDTALIDKHGGKFGVAQCRTQEPLTALVLGEDAETNAEPLAANRERVLERPQLCRRDRKLLDGFVMTPDQIERLGAAHAARHGIGMAGVMRHHIREKRRRFVRTARTGGLSAKEQRVGRSPRGILIVTTNRVPAREAILISPAQGASPSSVTRARAGLYFEAPDAHSAAPESITRVGFIPDG